MELKAVFDSKGSEARQLRRYTFGKVGDAVSGGVYVDKAIPLPDTLTIRFVEVEEVKCQRSS